MSNAILVDSSVLQCDIVMLDVQLLKVKRITGLSHAGSSCQRRVLDPESEGTMIPGNTDNHLPYY
jgi:hypothetical protein